MEFDNNLFSDSSDDLVESNRIIKHQKLGDQVENWWPSDVKSALDLEDMQVLILEHCNPIDVRNDLIESREVGLSVLVNDPDLETILVLLTTKSNIYVIEPGIESNVAFLRKRVKSKYIKFFTIDGAREADYIYRKMNIRLDKNSTDLKSFDLYLDTSSFYIDQTLASYTSFFTANYIRNYLKPKHRDYSALAAYWLGVNGKNFYCTRSELEATKSLPHNIMAKNAIKKHAALVRRLGVEMLKVYRRKLMRPSQNIFSFALLNNNVKEDFDKRGTNSYADLCKLTL